MLFVIITIMVYLMTVTASTIVSQDEKAEYQHVVSRNYISETCILGKKGQIDKGNQKYTIIPYLCDTMNMINLKIQD